MNWFQKLKTKLQKTSSAVTEKLASLFTHQKLSSDILQELEELLITTDIGVQTTSDIMKVFYAEKFDKNIDLETVKTILKSQITNILTPSATPLIIPKNSEKPHVILICGVNGNGKTTTIGKLTHKFQHQGHKVMLAACDTFRAAAKEQLEVWGHKNNCRVVTGKNKEDPASVAYKAMIEAQTEHIDVLIIDTAGRLHNNVNLMEELGKCTRVLKKLDNAAPHEIILVIDGTTGQNAISQIESFHSNIKISGTIITKLDSTAKGGILINIAHKFKLPIYGIGVGEAAEDMIDLDPAAFASVFIE